MVLSWSTSWTLLALLAQSGGVGQAGVEQDSLRRIDPAPGARAQAELLPPLDEVVWSAILSDSDLEAREEAYDDLLRRARKDPVAEQWLVDVAASSGDLTLAWTARMALRELACMQSKPKRQRAPRFLRTPSLMVGDQMSGELAELETRLKQLFGDIGVQVIGPSFAPPQGPADLWSEGIARVPSSQHRIQVEQRPGLLKLRVHTTRAGQESIQDYEGSSLEELLRSHPDLEEELGLEVFQSLGGSRGYMVAIARGARPKTPDTVDQTDFLGVHLAPVPPERADELSLAPNEGLIVTGVGAGTIARALGLRIGDVLVSVGDLAVRSLDDVTTGLAQAASGGRVGVVWIDVRGRRRDKTWSSMEPVRQDRTPAIEPGPGGVGATPAEPGAPPADGADPGADANGARQK